MAQKCQIFSDSVQVSNISGWYLLLVKNHGTKVSIFSDSVQVSDISTCKKSWHKSVKYFQILCKCQISQVDQLKRVAIQICRSSSLQRSWPPFTASGDDRSSTFFQILLFAWKWKLEQVLHFIQEILRSSTWPWCPDRHVGYMFIITNVP